jgi:hypothetical protein
MVGVQWVTKGQSAEIADTARAERSTVKVRRIRSAPHLNGCPANLEIVARRGGEAAKASREDDLDEESGRDRSLFSPTGDGRACAARVYRVYLRESSESGFMSRYAGERAANADQMLEQMAPEIQAIAERKARGRQEEEARMGVAAEVMAELTKRPGTVLEIAELGRHDNRALIRVTLGRLVKQGQAMRRLCDRGVEFYPASASKKEVASPPRRRSAKRATRTRPLVVGVVPRTGSISEILHSKLDEVRAEASRLEAAIAAVEGV